MESIVVIAILTLIVIAILPIISFIKLISLGNDINFLSQSLNYLDTQINKLIKRNSNYDYEQVISKNEILEVIDAINQLTKKVEDLDSRIKNTSEPPKENPIETPIVALHIEEPTIIYDEPIVENENQIETIITNKQPIEVLPNKKNTISYRQKNIKDDKKAHVSFRIDKKTTVPKTEDSLRKNLLEKLLNEKLLSKIGIVTFVLGVGFFVKYAIDQNWINEIARVGIGLFTGGLIIAIAHKLKEKYDIFSSILAGGGIAVFYITITLAFREYELFSQTVAFGILIVVTIFSVLLSLLYDRKELAVFSLLGGFGAPLMISTGEGNYVVLFSYIFILNSGMLLIAFRKKWHLVSIVSYTLTLLFYWIWLFDSFKNEFLGATIFGSIFFIQFYMIAIIDHIFEKYKITPFQIILILTNNISIFSACMIILSMYSYNTLGLATITLAVINGIAMYLLFRNSKVDRNLIYLVVAIVMTFISLAIPIQLEGCAITMLWAVEMVAFLWLWQKSEIKIFRIGFYLISILVFISFGMDLFANYDSFTDKLPIVFNRIFVTGLTLIGAVIMTNILLQKEDNQSEIKIKGVVICKTKQIKQIFASLLILMTFIVPFLEINYQVMNYFELDGAPASFRSVILGVYTQLYIAIVTLYHWRKTQHRSFIYNCLFISVILYTIIYSYLTTWLRNDIYIYSEYPFSYFLFHLIALPPMIIQMVYLIKNIKIKPANRFSAICWIITILSVIILSVELDNITILSLGNADNYHYLLFNVYTFGYPILWGTIALMLMIWGLKQKIVILRKISLSFFAIIIIKFYAYDVWKMSQAGRIISFVILGLIFLSVSFLQQKIKTLVKKDNEIE